MLQAQRANYLSYSISPTTVSLCHWTSLPLSLVQPLFLILRWTWEADTVHRSHRSELSIAPQLNWKLVPAHARPALVSQGLDFESPDFKPLSREEMFARLDWCEIAIWKFGHLSRDTAAQSRHELSSWWWNSTGPSRKKLFCFSRIFFVVLHVYAHVISQCSVSHIQYPRRASTLRPSTLMRYDIMLSASFRRHVPPSCISFSVHANQHLCKFFFWSSNNVFRVERAPLLCISSPYYFHLFDPGPVRLPSGICKSTRHAIANRTLPFFSFPILNLGACGRLRGNQEENANAFRVIDYESWQQDLRIAAGSGWKSGIKNQGS